jgi:hypothetical protein
MSEPARIVHLARPLRWVVALELTRGDAQLIGEVLAGMPTRTALRNYRALALRLTILAELVTSDDIRRTLERIAKRCEAIHDRTFSVVGAALVARHRRDEATCAALRKLTHDQRVLELLGLTH